MILCVKELAVLPVRQVKKRYFLAFACSIWWRLKVEILGKYLQNNLTVIKSWLYYLVFPPCQHTLFGSLRFSGASTCDGLTKAYRMPPTNQLTVCRTTFSQSTDICIGTEGHPTVNAVIV